jgi:uncharacterized membrane protein
MPKLVAVRTVCVVVAFAIASMAGARFEWRDVEQQVSLLPDGTVVVRDERTLWTPDEDFGEAFICIGHDANVRVNLLQASTVPPVAGVRGFQQPCEAGTEVVVAHPTRVRESRVLFQYTLTGTMQAHSDVVQWYWNLLQLSHPPIVGYRLEVRAPGPMAEPYDAFVMRYRNPETPRVNLSADRATLTVAFNRIPTGDGVEIRYLMDPRLFTLAGTAPGLERYLRDQVAVSQVEALTLIDVVRRRDPRWLIIPIVWSLLLLVGIGRSYLAVGRETKTDGMRYPFEPPSDLPPAAVTSLRFQQVSESTMGAGWLATLMDFARRGIIGFEGEGRSFAITLPSERPAEGLLPFEEGVLTYLLKAGARSRTPGRLTLAELTGFSRSHGRNHMRTFSRDVRTWLEGARGGKLLRPESTRAATQWALLATAGAIGQFLMFMTYAEGVAANGFLVGFVVSLLAAFVAMFALPSWRPDIALENAGWQGFQRTLNDYTRMKDAPPDFFNLWDRYFVYAAALGVAARFLRNLERVAPVRALDQRSMMQRGAWMGAANARDLSSLMRTANSLSNALKQAGASASSGGSSSGGGGGGGGGGSSGGR